MLIVEPRESVVAREAEASEVERSTLAARPSKKSKRAEYRCEGCGYGIIAYGHLPSCPMCRESRWEPARPRVLRARA